MAKMTCLSAALLLYFFLFLRSNARNSTGIRGLTQENPLRIGLPWKPFSEKFIQRNRYKKNASASYDGFSVKVFEAALNQLKHKPSYNFSEFTGTYDDLVASVGNGTLDGAVGDITMTAKRWELVEFTVPYTQSGLALVGQVNNDQTWILFKPFSWELWLATVAIFCYSLLSLWFLEQRSNPEFGGSRYHQLGNALWFTLTSLFFAQRGAIKSNHTRVVVVVWLFVVFIIMQSFTANLSSMLTVNRLNRNMDLTKTEHEKVGCNPFVKEFVENELRYKEEAIKLMRLEKEYLTAFKTGNISVALLEIPYAEILANKRCKQFTITRSKYNFGGFGFAFNKDYAKIASDMSQAILNLSQSGKLKKLEEHWISSSSECSNSQVNQDPEGLSLKSFSTLYLIAATIMSLTVLVFIARLLSKYQKCKANDIYQGEEESVWRKVTQVLIYLKDAKLENRGDND